MALVVFVTTMKLISVAIVLPLNPAGEEDCRTTSDTVISAYIPNSLPAIFGITEIKGAKTWRPI